MLRRLLILASLLLAPAAAWGQFATFVPPKAKATDSASSLQAAKERAKADSATAARIANMKRWVDSAAGLPPRTTVTSDSVLMPGDTTTVLVASARGRSAAAEARVPTPPPPTSSPRSAASAPATASDLPLMLVVGVGLVAAGIMVLAGTPRGSHHA